MKKFVISSSSTIYEAFEKIEINKKGFLLVLNENLEVTGTLTDGDLRRGILNGFSIQDSIKNLVCKSFESLSIDSNFTDICEKFKSEKIEFLPIIDKNMKLVNIITKKQFHIMLLENVNFDLTYDFFIFDNHILEHEIYNRPWGYYKSTILTSHAQGKIITLFPKSELSLQEHKKREEHWIIIKGKGKIILGESILDIYPGKYIYIPKGCKHQIINDGDENIILSEVQLGEYFGEDDIIRYNDKYGRK
ncbi:CBS domain-containing protein [Aliarcobacter lanthieri]|uniref:CBS domain-containing protein n=1 Tax=Aliarcobacter lanthieri TaxID=1355374 RepID=UPI003AAE56A0